MLASFTLFLFQAACSNGSSENRSLESDVIEPVAVASQDPTEPESAEAPGTSEPPDPLDSDGPSAPADTPVPEDSPTPAVSPPPTVTPDPSETPDTEQTPGSPDSLPIPAPLIDISPELQNLVGSPVWITARFIDAQSDILDSFMYNNQDISEAPGGSPFLRTTDENGTISCADAPHNQEVLCLRVFQTNPYERVLYRFEFHNETTGTGVFEYCDGTVAAEACLGKLSDSPDGLMTANLSVGSSRAASAPSPAPYMAYEQQGFEDKFYDAVIPENLRIAAQSVSSY